MRFRDRFTRLTLPHKSASLSFSFTCIQTLSSLSLSLSLSLALWFLSLLLSSSIGRRIGQLDSTLLIITRMRDFRRCVSQTR